jgi:ATP-binding cassette subfamily F protein uup
VLIVSHDRDFLDRTVTITLGLDGSGKVDVVAGGYEDWAKRRTPPVAPKRPQARPGAQVAPPPPPPPARTRLTYKDQRDYDLLPERIDALDATIARHEKELADPGLYARDPAAFERLTKAIAAARDEKDAAEHRWLELAAQLEE